MNGHSNRPEEYESYEAGIDIPTPESTSSPEENPYGASFIKFMNDNPTVFHAVDSLSSLAEDYGYTYLPETADWSDLLLNTGCRKFYTTRNGSSLIAFEIGEDWTPGGGVGVIGGHIDALTAKLKPISKKAVKQGYRQLGVAPYSGSLGPLWFDRDLGLGGRVILRNGSEIEARTVALDGPIARIPTLAPHFGSASTAPYNLETKMVPIYALSSSDQDDQLTEEEATSPLANSHDIFILRAIAKKLNVSVKDIIQLELELFDTQPATFGGLNKEFIFSPRLDDKLCSYAALQALISSKVPSDVINCVALFDNEEVGSKTRQGAAGGVFQTTVRRVIDVYHGDEAKYAQTSANSFFVSSDVAHAVNPNYLEAYLESHMPQLNVGPVLKIDANMSYTSDGISVAFAEECASLGTPPSKLQYFHGRNDIRGGGTIGPMLSAATGIRAVDIGIPQLSMHSIRATTGSKDVDLGVLFYQNFYENWSAVNKKFIC